MYRLLSFSVNLKLLWENKFVRTLGKANQKRVWKGRWILVSPQGEAERGGGRWAGAGTQLPRVLTTSWLVQAPRPHRRPRDPFKSLPES